MRPIFCQIKEYKGLKEITGAFMNFTFVSKPKLVAISRFLPENVLLGRNDRVGGVLEDPNKRSKN